MSTATRRFARAKRAEYGLYQWHDWQRFYDQLGVTYVTVDLPEDLNGFLYNNVVFLRAGMWRGIEAFTAWHEIGHYLLHEGNAAWWLLQPQGDITLARMEYQAHVFAVFFPVWEGEDEQCDSRC